MKSLRARRACLRHRSLKRVLPQLRLTKPGPSLLLGSSGSAPTIGRRLSPTATTAQSLYSGSQLEHRHFFDVCSQRDLSRLAGLGQRRRRSWRFICQAMASPTIQDCARKVCRKDIMSTVASRATNRSLSECSMNTTDTFSPFWARVCTIIKLAVGIWPAGAQRDALAALSQDIQAIEIYAGNIADGETAANVAGRIITKFLYRL